MSKLNKEIAASLSQEWNTREKIEAKGYGSSAWLAPQILINKSFMKLQRSFPMFSLPTLVKLWTMSDPLVEEAISDRIDSLRLVIPRQREIARRELTTQAYEMIDMIDFEEALKRKPSADNTSNVGKPSEEAKSVVRSMCIGMEEQTSRLKEVFPMYTKPTLVRILIASNFAIDCHIREEEAHCQLEIPGQWERQKKDLEEQVWQILQENDYIAKAFE